MPINLRTEKIIFLLQALEIYLSPVNLIDDTTSEVSETKSWKITLFELTVDTAGCIGYSTKVVTAYKVGLTRASMNAPNGPLCAEY